MISASLACSSPKGMKALFPVSVPKSILMPRARALSTTPINPSKCRFMRLTSIWITSCPYLPLASSTMARKVMVGMIGMPALATASSSASPARSAWTIQSTPASAAARVEPAPREWIATRALRR
jgi:hypothetical protein